MKTFENIPIRIFPVRIQDKRSGSETDDEIVLTKATLLAAQLVGESSKELIHREYDRKGYRVLEIGKARKLTITVDLEKEAARAEAKSAEYTENDQRLKQNDNTLKHESQVLQECISK